MENCFVEKIKGDTNNENLLVFDALKVTVMFSQSDALTRIDLNFGDGAPARLGGVGVIYKPVANCHITNGNGESIETDGQYVMPSGNSYAYVTATDATKDAEFLMIGMSKITNVFSFNSFSFTKMEQKYLDKIKYCTLSDAPTNFRPLGTPSPIGGVVQEANLNYIKDLQINKSVVTKITLQGNNNNIIDLSAFSEYANLTKLPTDEIYKLTGDVSDIQNLTSITELNLNNRTEVSGQIANLAKMTGLDKLLLYGTKIVGNIEDYVAARVAASVAAGGSQSGSLNDFNPNGIIRFQSAIIPTGTHKTISWTSANPSDITVTNKA